jgi:hypothetical protein
VHLFNYIGVSRIPKRCLEMVKVRCRFDLVFMPFADKTSKVYHSRDDPLRPVPTHLGGAFASQPIGEFGDEFIADCSDKLFAERNA